MEKRNKNKIIAIVGPTASGKTDLSIKLARKFNGEIVSADSRQIYKEMDIGTGKIKKEEMMGIKHYLLDVASPKRTFSVGQYQRKALEAIKKILKKDKLPFLVGGSPFYIYSLTDGIKFPKVKPDKNLRKKLEKKSPEQLFQILKKIDKKRAAKIDKNNPRRLIRAIEITQKLGKVPSLEKKSSFKVLFIGIKREKEELRNLIKIRLKKRLKEGLIEEVEKLKKTGLSWQRLDGFGLEYRWISRYLKGEISKKEMIEKLENDIWRFSRKQMTWLKKDKRIHWLKKEKEVEKLIKNFLIKKEEV